MTLVAAIAIAVALVCIGYAAVARTRERRFASMFENSTEMMCMYDVDGNIVRCNPAALRRLGFAASDTGQHFSIHVAPEDCAMVEHAFAQTLAGQANELATVFVDAQAKRVPVVANLAPIVVHGRTVGVIGAARDVSAEQLYEEHLLSSQERYRALFEQSAHAVVAIKRDGTISAINVAMELLSGYRNEEIVGKSSLLFSPPDRREMAQERLADLSVHPRAVAYEAMLLCRGDHEIPVAIDVLPVRIKGRVESFYMTVKDLTHERALVNRLSAKDGRFSALYRVASSAGSAAVQIDQALALGAESLAMPYGFVLERSHGAFDARHRLGPQDGVMPPAGVAQRLVESPRALALDDFDGGKSCIGSRISIRGETYGTLVFLDLQPREPQFDQSDLDFIDLLVVLVSGAVAREIDDRELQAHSLRDPLTGLANRLKLDQEITRSIARARRSQDGFALHFIDLDRFKPVNDTWGHEAGDSVLQRISRRLSEMVRSGDVVARIGGDEFVVLQAGVKDAASTVEFGERIAAAVTEPIRLDDERTASVDCSIGLALFPKDGTNAQALIRAADAAMYRAKERHGSNSS
jgi:diguanylate cyclase (GGDEF)-like protein/PAS domain S-box-containing protein